MTFSCCIEEWQIQQIFVGPLQRGLKQANEMSSPAFGRISVKKITAVFQAPGKIVGVFLKMKRQVKAGCAAGKFHALQAEAPHGFRMMSALKSEHRLYNRLMARRPLCSKGVHHFFKGEILILIG